MLGAFRFRILDFGFKRPHRQDSGCELRVAWGVADNPTSRQSEIRNRKFSLLRSKIRNPNSEIETIPIPKSPIGYSSR